LEAYTIKPDGTRLDVKSDAIFTQATPVAVSAPMFNDIKLRIIVFPEPLKDGKIVLRTRTTQRVAQFPGHISFVEGFSSLAKHLGSRITISAPNDYPLNFDSRGLQGGTKEEEGDRYRWTWTYTNSVPRISEPYEVVETDFGAYLAVTSFPNWMELGKAYEARAEPQTQPSEELNTLAAQIVKPAKDRRQQVRRVHDWVARNIRYVGVFLGLGGVVPRSAADILATKYGDCKDHTTLLISLLRARGIVATTALVQTADAFELPKVAVVGAFNHAVVHVPEFDLYLDATSPFEAWNIPPQTIAGKRALLTGLGKLVEIPKSNANTSAVHSMVSFTVSKDGRIVGQSIVDTSGSFEAILRANVASIPSGQQEGWAVNWIKRVSPKASATLRKSAPFDLTTPLIFEVKFAADEVIPLESPGAFTIPKGLTEFAIDALAGFTVQTGKRVTPFPCTSDTRTEVFEIRLPEAVRVYSLPKPVVFQGKTVRFESTYRQEGNVIHAKRKVVRDRPRAVCEPEMWEETEQLATAIMRDARGQVRLR
jgi:hypothetical protein